MLPSACSFVVEVSCHCFTLHVSAYMAIFRCVGYYYSHVLEGICFAGFFYVSCTWLHFLRFHLWGGLNMRYYLLLFMLYLTVMVYMSFTYMCFPVKYIYHNSKNSINNNK
jgi:hypothetical protein